MLTYMILLIKKLYERFNQEAICRGPGQHCFYRLSIVQYDVSAISVDVDDNLTESQLRLLLDFMVAI